MANNRGNNIKKAPKVNESHVVNSEQSKFVHGVVGKTNSYSGAISFVTFKRPGGPNCPERAQRHSEVDRSGGSKHVGEVKYKSMVSASQNNKVVPQITRNVRLFNL